MVVVNAVTCRGVLRKLFNSVVVKNDFFGSVNCYCVSNGGVVLIGNCDCVFACNVLVVCRGINCYVSNIEGIGLAACECSVKSKAVQVDILTCKIVNLTGSHKLEAVFSRNLNVACKAKSKDILCTVVLTAGDSPNALCYFNVDLYYGVAFFTCNEFNVVNCSVGSSNGNELHLNAAGAVLYEEGKCTCTGNVNEDLCCRVTNLNGLCILSSVVCLCSVSYF